jgi:hypothetical protein
VKVLKRRALDYYPSGTRAAAALYGRLPGIRHVAEPCVGTGDLVADSWLDVMWTNDIDHTRQADYRLDAAQRESWLVFPRPRWVVTNPPFSQAAAILANALEFATDGVAMILRLSFLEPCAGREQLLLLRPPTRLIVLPRMSFTNDGKTDSVTCAWMVWSRYVSPGVEVVPRDEIRGRR